MRFEVPRLTVSPCNYGNLYTTCNCIDACTRKYFEAIDILLITRPPCVAGSLLDTEFVLLVSYEQQCASQAWY